MVKVYRVDENCQECKGISLRLEKPGAAYEDWQIEEFYLTKDELAVLYRLRLIVTVTDARRDIPLSVARSEEKSTYDQEI